MSNKMHQNVVCKTAAIVDFIVLTLQVPLPYV